MKKITKPILTSLLSSALLTSHLSQAQASLICHSAHADAVFQFKPAVHNPISSQNLSFLTAQPIAKPLFTETPISSPTFRATAKAYAALVILNTTPLKNLQIQKAQAQKYLDDKSAYEKKMAGLETLRSEAQAKLSRNKLQSTGRLRPKFDLEIQGLVEKAQNLIEQSYSEDQIQRTLQEMNRFISDQINLSRELGLITSEADYTLNGLTDKAPTRILKNALSKWHLEALHIMKETNSIPELKAQAEAAIHRAQSELDRYEAELLARQKKELRFNVESSATAQPIFENFLVFAESIGNAKDIQEIRQSGSTILSYLKTHKEARVLLYREMQFLRRLQTKSALKIDERVQDRLANDLFALRMQATEGRTGGGIGRLILLRENLSQLPKSMLQTLGLRSLSRSEKEKLISDALRSEELTTSLLASQIQISEPKLPPQPNAPSKTGPTKPNLKPRNKTKSEASRIVREAKAYKRAVQAWAVSWRTYGRQMKQFKEDVDAYKIARNKAKEARKYKSLAQQNLKAYFVYRQPQVFRSAARASQLRQHLNTTRAERQARLQQEEIRRLQAANQRYKDDSDFTDWMMYAYTRDPMWLIAPDYARVQFMMHMIFNDSPVSNRIASEATNDPNLSTDATQIESQAQSLRTQYQDQIPAQELDPAFEDLRALPTIDTPDNISDSLKIESPEGISIADQEAVEQVLRESSLSANTAELAAQQAEEEAARAEQSAHEAEAAAQQAEEQARAAEIAAQQAEQQAAEAEKAAADAERAAQEAEREAAQAEREAAQAEQDASRAEAAAQTDTLSFGNNNNDSDDN